MLRLQRLRRRVTTKCTFAFRGRRWRHWIPGAPKRCSTMFPRALGHKYAAPVLQSVPVQQCDIVTQSCLLHLTMETPCGPVCFTIPFVVLTRGDDVVIIGQTTLRQTHGIDVMVHRKASVLKARRRKDSPEMEIKDGAVGEPNAGAMLQAVMVVTAFGPGGDAPGDVEDDVTRTLLSQRSMMFQDSELEFQERVGALEAAIDDALDYGLRPECAKMLHDIVFRTHRDVFRWALLGDPP